MQPDVQNKSAPEGAHSSIGVVTTAQDCHDQAENSSPPAELNITYDYRQAAGLVLKGLGEHDFPEPALLLCIIVLSKSYLYPTEPRHSMPLRAQEDLDIPGI